MITSCCLIYKIFLKINVILLINLFLILLVLRRDWLWLKCNNLLLHWTFTFMRITYNDTRNICIGKVSVTLLLLMISKRYRSCWKFFCFLFLLSWFIDWKLFFLPVFLLGLFFYSLSFFLKLPLSLFLLLDLLLNSLSLFIYHLLSL